jgi:hypothetical protein
MRFLVWVGLLSLRPTSSLLLRNVQPISLWSFEVKSITLRRCVEICSSKYQVFLWSAEDCFLWDSGARLHGFSKAARSITGYCIAPLEEALFEGKRLPASFYEPAPSGLTDAAYEGLALRLLPSSKRRQLDPCDPATSCSAPEILQEVNAGVDKGGAILGALDIIAGAASALGQIASVNGWDLEKPNLVGALLGFGSFGTGLFDGIALATRPSKTTESYWQVHKLEQFIQDSTAYMLCKMKILFGEYFEKYIANEDLDQFNKALIAISNKWNASVLLRICANHSGKPGDLRPVECLREGSGQQAPTSRECRRYDKGYIQNGTATCTLPSPGASLVLECEDTVPKGTCGLDLRCYGVYTIRDVGVSACETRKILNAASLYGEQLDEYTQLDAIDLYLRFILLQLILYNTQILSGIGGYLVVSEMQRTAAVWATWLEMRIMNFYVVANESDIYKQASEVAINDGWDLQSHTWWAGQQWYQCGTRQDGDRHLVHRIRFGCSNRKEVPEVLQENQWGVIGLHLDASDAAWCASAPHCNLTDLRITPRFCPCIYWTGTQHGNLAVWSPVDPEQPGPADCQIAALEGAATQAHACQNPSTRECLALKGACQKYLDLLWADTLPAVQAFFARQLDNYTANYTKMIAHLRNISTNKSYRATLGLADRLQLWPAPLATLSDPSAIEGLRHNILPDTYVYAMCSCLVTLLLICFFALFDVPLSLIGVLL